MNLFRQAIYKLLSSGSDVMTTGTGSDYLSLLRGFADDTPELRPLLARYAAGEVSEKDFTDACVMFMVKEIYAFRKEEENSRMQAW